MIGVIWSVITANPIARLLAKIAGIALAVVTFGAWQRRPRGEGKSDSRAGRHREGQEAARKGRAEAVEKLAAGQDAGRDREETTVTGSNLRAVALFPDADRVRRRSRGGPGLRRLWRGAGDHADARDRRSVGLGRHAGYQHDAGLPVKPSQAVALLVGRGCGKVERRGGIRTRDPAGWPPYRVRCSAAFDHSAHAAAHPQNLAESKRYVHARLDPDCRSRRPGSGADAAMHGASRRSRWLGAEVCRNPRVSGLTSTGALMIVTASEAGGFRCCLSAQTAWPAWSRRARGLR